MRDQPARRPMPRTGLARVGCARRPPGRVRVDLQMPQGKAPPPLGAHEHAVRDNPRAPRAPDAPPWRGQGLPAPALGLSGNPHRPHEPRDPDSPGWISDRVEGMSTQGCSARHVPNPPEPVTRPPFGHPLAASRTGRTWNSGSRCRGTPLLAFPDGSRESRAAPEGGERVGRRPVSRETRSCRSLGRRSFGGYRWSSRSLGRGRLGDP